MNKKGFSIAEMMVVMLILSIVLAAATPIITKRVIARANEATEQTSSNPTGSIIAYAGVVPPDGWLLCNGQSTAGHPELAAIIGANVPDLRGEFIRGWDNGRGVDSGRVFGSIQSWAIQNITGSFTFTDDDNPYYSARVRYTSGAFSSGDDGSAELSFADSHQIAGVPNYIIFDASRQVQTSTETRPRNVALNYIIKY